MSQLGAEAGSSPQLDALLELHRWPEALELARRRISEEPSDWYRHAQLARAMLGSEDVSGAHDATTLAVSLGPDEAYAHTLRGLSLWAANKEKKGLAAIRESVRLEPEAAHSRALLGEFLAVRAQRVQHHPNQRREALDEARAQARAAIELDPERPSGCLALAKIETIECNVAAARHAAETALALNPENAEARELPGRIAESQGDKAAAASHFLAAGRIDPTDPTALEHLRGLRKLGPVFVIVAVVVVRLVMRSGRLGDDLGTGAWPLVVITTLLGAALIAVVGFVLRHRRDAALPEDALRMLEADRSTRRRRWRRN